MKAPFPYFGGKSAIASDVWAHLGTGVDAYVEPFAGSLAVLLNRPGWTPDSSHIETVNDIDGHIANVWRAIAADPEKVAHYADWPVNENDLHARHYWLVQQKEPMRARLEGDPEWHDPKAAGWWIWGACCWIGSGWCSGKGGWRAVDGQLVHLGDNGNAGDGTQGIHAWMNALAERLSRVRVCSGDWRRVCTPAARGDRLGPTTAIFLDPPYSTEEDRAMNLYAHDNGTVAHDVREWAITETAQFPNLRVAICGYSPSPHDTLATDHGWTPVSWSTSGGMGNTSNARGITNRHRETVWYSPACIDPTETAGHQAALFRDTP